MDGVTDAAFRHIQKKYGQPNLVYTEFVTVEGLCHKAERLLKELIFTEIQRPVIAQFYGTTPDSFRQAAIVAATLGFDGIDINMGCPAKNVETSGAGAALIKTPELALQIVRATKMGVEEWQNGADLSNCHDLSNNIKKIVNQRHELLSNEYQDRTRQIPVSIKTRLGYDSIVIEDWIQTLLATEPAAIAIHGRTLKQGYSGEANWETIGLASQIIKKTSTLAIGNGDVKSYEEGLAKMKQYGVDGVLIGRASFGNPYVFRPNDESPLSNEARHNNESRISTVSQPGNISQPNTMTQPSNIPQSCNGTIPVSLPQIALEHAQIYEQIFAHQPHYHFLPMRKHLAWYISGQPNAKEIRLQLVRANNSQEVEEVLTKFSLL